MVKIALDDDMSEQTRPSMDDADGSCKQCGHAFNPHAVIAYDVNDFSKGGEIQCPVAECSCFHTLNFDLEATP